MRPFNPKQLPDFTGADLEPVDFATLEGWHGDDHAAAFRTFRASCPAVLSAAGTSSSARADSARTEWQSGLAQACTDAMKLQGQPDASLARLFFETYFQPFRIRPKTGGEGFFTGYYEPEVEGALVRGNGYEVPVLARPDDLMSSPDGTGRRAMPDGSLVPYYDRGEIEDGALAGRGLEIAYLKDPVDLFFAQIQGSARLRLPDGRVMRLEYAGKNGHAYVAVGRELIAKGLVAREEMSMARIRAYMAAHPDEGRALRRLNRSYVFFRMAELEEGAGPMGAQGVPLTAGRSLAIDWRIHVYGSPVFVEADFVGADLPLSETGGVTPFQRLMIAQDTGSAIVGPARGDLFFGAGVEAAQIAGQIRHAGRFTLLVPRFTPDCRGAS